MVFIYGNSCQAVKKKGSSSDGAGEIDNYGQTSPFAQKTHFGGLSSGNPIQ